jgi:hypothetical protein
MIINNGYEHLIDDLKYLYIELSFFFSSLIIKLFHNQSERISQSVSRHASYHNDCYIITVHLKYLYISVSFLHYNEFDLIESNVPLIREAILFIVSERNQRIP